MPRRPTSNKADEASMAPEPHRPADIYAPNPFPLDPTQPGGKSVRNPYFPTEATTTAAASSSSSNDPGHEEVSAAAPSPPSTKAKNQFQRFGVGLKSVFGKGSSAPLALPSQQPNVPSKGDEDAIIERRRQLYASASPTSSTSPSNEVEEQLNPFLPSATPPRRPPSTGPQSPSSSSKRWSTPVATSGAYRPSPLAHQSNFDDEDMRYPGNVGSDRHRDFSSPRPPPGEDEDYPDGHHEPTSDRIARAREWVARKNQQQKHRVSAPPTTLSAASLPGAFPTSEEARRTKWETSSNPSSRVVSNQQHQHVQPSRPSSHIYHLEDAEPLQPPRSTYVNMGRGYDPQDRMFASGASASHLNYVGGGSEGGDYPMGYYGHPDDDLYGDHAHEGRYPISAGAPGRSRDSYEMEVVDTLQDDEYSVAGSEKPASSTGGIHLAADRKKKAVAAASGEDLTSIAESQSQEGEASGEGDGLTTGELKQPAHPPNKRRLILRIVSGKSTPFSSVYGLVIHFLVAILSTIISFFFVFNYFSRRLHRRPKLKRYVLLGLDIVLALFWFADVFICLSRFPCEIGANEGWCDMYNTSLFSGVVAMISFLIAFGWDIWGAFKRTKKYDPYMDPAMAEGYYDPATGQWIPGGYPNDPATAAEYGYGYGYGYAPDGYGGRGGRGTGRGRGHGRGGRGGRGGKKDKVPFEFR
ncbi:hypothetical protein BGZ73_004289 [Actinomortierella ambigua]|nr:hypothetical protein BGZ73_004289 [Actinomortierella ambigua]